VGAEETVRANRRWWDAAADAYQSEHGEFLGGRNATRFIWGPEGLDESDAPSTNPMPTCSLRSPTWLGAGYSRSAAVRLNAPVGWLPTAR